MAEIKLRFDITFSRRLVAWTGAAAMMLCVVPELDSESVTLSTYYPAPSGVYTQMITTGNTYLARDGGNVGVGTASPAQKLHVAGNLQADRIKFPGVGGDSGVTPDYYAIYQESGGWSSPYPDLRVQYHTGIKYDAYYGYGGHRFYTGYDGSGNPSGSGPVTGAGPTLSIDSSIKAAVPIVYTGPTCNIISYGFGVQACAAGQYVTFTSGVMVKMTYGTATEDSTGTMLCCPCPVDGCPSL